MKKEIATNLISRRDFITKSTLAGAGVLVGSSFLAQALACSNTNPSSIKKYT